MTGRVLLIEDDEALLTLLRSGLSRRGHDVAPMRTADAALAALDEHDFDVVLTDLQLGGTDGIALCEQVVTRRPGTPVIVMTAFGSLENAVRAMRAGAWDFLPKPVDLGVLELALERALSHRRLSEELVRLRTRVSRREGVAELIGESPPMRRLVELLDRVADAPSPVLVHGETGTGKEVVAKALHRMSSRRDKPFVAINCAAVPESLLESELFGHTRGAFTDAKTDRTGLFVTAHGGTLFLDEIGDMPLGLQPKLLRVLEDRAVRPVGASREVPVDVRIVAATHRDLEEDVEEGRFRADLLYRLDVVRIELPTLRERGADVLLLAQEFLGRQAERLGRPVTGFTPEAARKLLEYDWPGNVRELQNCVERAVLLARFDKVGVEDLPRKISDYEPKSTVIAAFDDPAALVPLAEVERRYVNRVLEIVGGNKATAARILGIDRKTLYRKLRDESTEEV